jgi:amidase
MAEALEAQGHEVGEGDPHFDVAGAGADVWKLEMASVAARVAMWSGRVGREPESGDFEPVTWYLLERGRRLGAAELVQAVTSLQRASREIAAFYESIDVWVSPTLGTPPFPLGYLRSGPHLSAEEALRRDEAVAAFTWPVNMTGQPALSYPIGRSPEGLPIGVQLTGRFGREEILLGIAGDLDRTQSDRP